MTKNNETVRVRFAPSPTGYLHVGGARTALFNWLFAKHHNGTFVLRIEDTDITRSSQESNESILDGMEWLGLYWEEGPKTGGSYGPYFQAQRLEIYNNHAKKLLDEGKAFYCFCTAQELEEKRRQSEARKEAPKYDGKCRKLSQSEIEKNLKNKIPYVVRFKLPATGDTHINDMIRGKVVFKNEVLDDFVIMKSDGFPTYNFAAVIDDSLMKITHVIRGDDHLSNTPRQILLYKAFGFSLPHFAHIPMILGKDKTRLSKRHGATSVTQYRDLGYLQEGMLNYLARLGWGHGDQEIFSRNELIEKFSLNAVNKSPAVFDNDKLDWLNGQYIRKTLPERLTDLCLPHLEKTFPEVKELQKTKEGRQYIVRIISCVQERMKVLPEVSELSSYFFEEIKEYEKEAEEKYFKTENASKILSDLKQGLSKLKQFNKDAIEIIFKQLAKEMDVKLGIIIHPARLALTGKKVSPGIYDVVEILGKDKVVSRLEKAITYLAR